MKISALTGIAASLVVVAASAAHAADVQDNWGQNCASCHGKDGAGHTKAGKLVGVKDLTDAQYQKSFTDDQAAKDIKNGLKNPAGKDVMMPVGDKLSDADIKALVEFVRKMAK